MSLKVFTEKFFQYTEKGVSWTAKEIDEHRPTKLRPKIRAEAEKIDHAKEECRHAGVPEDSIYASMGRVEKHVNRELEASTLSVELLESATSRLFPTWETSVPSTPDTRVPWLGVRGKRIPENSTPHLGDPHSAAKPVREGTTKSTHSDNTTATATDSDEEVLVSRANPLEEAKEEYRVSDPGESDDTDDSGVETPQSENDSATTGTGRGENRRSDREIMKAIHVVKHAHERLQLSPQPEAYGHFPGDTKVYPLYLFQPVNDSIEEVDEEELMQVRYQMNMGSESSRRRQA
ncbi:hypothetical protein CALVIDRAFT_528415 [Calocera viscosa TUFC12733]|uniref:Uncharacterized protein n=1 Tax=Calocera viscosa (strain TUFC12733) TaxID=1330018 RepID=A0A167KVB9_CALVF|nr:hypothetical protein CALVIDRAFT_528415 [Calocera viscosa TUFC12733]